MLENSPDLTAARRASDLEALESGRETLDVLVVGGGVTGAGVALDAASRGLKVALIERRDLANGTSRWSSKLVHGGLRYLAKGQVGVAWESARERALLIDRIAPHLVRPLPFLLPIPRETARVKANGLEIGIRIGDAMRAAAGTSRRRLPPARRVSAEEAQRWAPGIDRDAFRGAILHWDGQLEDDARLVVEIARTAASLGARILTYTAALELNSDGARVRDESGTQPGAPFDIRARHVINATGVWAGELAPRIELTPSRGSHLLVPAELLGDPRAGVSVAVPGASGRFVFAHPRSDGLVTIGLTDEPHSGAIPDEPLPTAEEERFLLETIGRALDRPLQAADVAGRYSGLRPLLRDPEGSATADISRRHAVLEHDGVTTVVGGKLTTYRRMAQDAVDRITDVPCRTHKLPLIGATGPIDDALPPRLVRRFGANAGAVAKLADGRPELLKPVAGILPVELLYAYQAELAMTLDDVLDRRTRAGLVPERRAAVEHRRRASCSPSPRSGYSTASRSSSVRAPGSGRTCHAARPAPACAPARSSTARRRRSRAAPAPASPPSSRDRRRGPIPPPSPPAARARPSPGRPAGTGPAAASGRAAAARDRRRRCASSADARRAGGRRRPPS